MRDQRTNSECLIQIRYMSAEEVIYVLR